MSAFLESSEPAMWCCMKCSYLSLPFCAFSHNLGSCLLRGSYSLLFVSFCYRPASVMEVCHGDWQQNNHCKEVACNVSSDGFSNSLWREEGTSADSDLFRDTNLASRSPQCTNVLFMARTRLTWLWIFRYCSPLESSSGWVFWISTSSFSFPSLFLFLLWHDDKMPGTPERRTYGRNTCLPVWNLLSFAL